MSKHTPGDWWAIMARVEHASDDVADIASCNPADFGQEHLGRSYPEMFANARLIAAAPEMYDAIKARIEAADRELTNDWAANTGWNYADGNPPIQRAKGYDAERAILSMIDRVEIDAADTA